MLKAHAEAHAVVPRHVTVAKADQKTHAPARLRQNGSVSECLEAFGEDLSGTFDAGQRHVEVRYGAHPAVLDRADKNAMLF